MKCLVIMQLLFFVCSFIMGYCAGSIVEIRDHIKTLRKSRDSLDKISKLLSGKTNE